MSSQGDHPTYELPFNIEYAFQELYGQLPSDAARLRLRKVKEIFKLEGNDALWSVLLALDYHYSLYKSLPTEIEGLSNDLVASLTTALEEFKLFKHCISQKLTVLGDELLNELIKNMTMSIEDEVTSASREITSCLSQLVGYLHDVAGYSILSEPIEIEYKKMTTQYQVEMRASIHKTKNEIEVVYQTHIPPVKMKLLIALMIAIMITSFIGIKLSIDLIRHSSWDDAAYRVMGWQHSLQSKFYHGLDKKTRVILDRRNAQLPHDQQLYVGLI